jgi:hypothetical protein
MRKIPTAAIMVALAAAAGAVPATSAHAEEYKTRLDECREPAKVMKFGVHFIRRDRWIRACLRDKI